MKATYAKDYCLRNIKSAIDFAEAEGNFNPLRIWINELERSINADNALCYEDRKQDDVEHNAEMLREGRKEIADFLEREE